LDKNSNLNRFEVYTNIDLFDFILCKENFVDCDNFVIILFVLTLNHCLFGTRNKQNN